MFRPAFWSALPSVFPGSARISAVQATAGVSIELLEFPPDSLVRKAITAWK